MTPRNETRTLCSAGRLLGAVKHSMHKRIENIRKLVRGRSGPIGVMLATRLNKSN